jgi:phenylacetaldehyde dehydrogenase
LNGPNGLLHAPLFIDGAWCEAAHGATLETVNPADGTRLGTLAAASATDVDRAVRVADAAFESGVWRDAGNQHRARVLNRFADLFEAELETFYTLETRNNGRPIVETRAQIGRLPYFYRYFASLALTYRDSVIPIEGPFLHYTQRVPLGVAALMPSFNHPLMILTKSLAPALATGNSVVIKPSEQTPYTTGRVRSRARRFRSIRMCARSCSRAVRKSAAKSVWPQPRTSRSRRSNLAARARSSCSMICRSNVP